MLLERAAEIRSHFYTLPAICFVHLHVANDFILIMDRLIYPECLMQNQEAQMFHLALSSSYITEDPKVGLASL